MQPQIHGSNPQSVTSYHHMEGQSGATLRIATPDGEAAQARSVDVLDHAAAVPHLLKVIGQHAIPIRAVGHRIVHGGSRFSAPEVVGGFRAERAD